jgi:hypothetical protein
MTFHKTVFRNIGSSQYAYDAKYAGNRRYRLRVPAHSEVVSQVPEEIYPLLIADAGQPKYSHIQVIEPESATAPEPVTVPSVSAEKESVPAADDPADPEGKTGTARKKKG